MIEYLTDSFAWSFVGLVAGYMLGKTELVIRSKFKDWRRHDHT